MGCYRHDCEHWDNCEPLTDPYPGTCAYTEGLVCEHADGTLPEDVLDEVHNDAVECLSASLGRGLLGHIGRRF